MSAYFSSPPDHPSALFTEPAAAVAGGRGMLYLNYPHSPYQDVTAGGLHHLQQQHGAGGGVFVPLPSMLQSESRNGAAAAASFDSDGGGDHPLSLQSQLLALHGQQHQGLSLSLGGTQMPVSVYQPHPAGAGGSRQQMQVSIASYGHTGAVADMVAGSKYLKAAQELLAEVVNVSDAIQPKPIKSNSEGNNNDAKSTSTDAPAAAAPPAELSPAERQELQNKVGKLQVMLDEVDQRYRHYYHQMQIVVSSFDIIAGAGAARPYTALALQTISRHFRSLRDAISGQIQQARRALGEPDAAGRAGGGISRLRYIDQQLRAQRAAQQFGGAAQPQAWRPQRGLPESSVSVLRAWLFEHFLHPYPKDSEKLMLARQTGLSRSQVSNWFINARVRLWKPMIEDMYKDEFGEAAAAEADSISSSDVPHKPGKNSAGGDDISNHDLQSPSTDGSIPGGQPNYMPTAVTNAYGFHRRHAAADSLLQDAIPSVGEQRFMTYHLMPELGHYEAGGVSLTLGLQHSNEQPGMMAAHRGGGGDIYGVGAMGTDAVVDFDYMASSESHQRFSSPLLHDFVA